MKIHSLQHIEFETEGTIAEWIEEKKHTLSTTHIYKNENFPVIDDFDFLIIMGGPMNIYEYEKYPWLRAEKAFIKETISSGKAVIGICLGAQLIADVLGATMSKNNYKEIGWFPVHISKETGLSKEKGPETPILKDIPEEFIAFHWHGDTFNLPEGSKRLFSSEACKNQGFIYGDRIIGLQFHLEMSNRTIGNLIENCSDELIEGKYIQSEKEMLNKDSYIAESNQLMFRLLNYLERTIKS
jgi:GMP synthase-like glutamine amidotransferase